MALSFWQSLGATGVRAGSTDAPVQGHLRVKHGDGACAGCDLFRIGDGVAFGQRHGALVDGQTVEGWTVEGGEGFERVEGVVLFKDFGEDRHRVGGCEASGTAAGMLFQIVDMGCAVGAKEKCGIA